MREVPKVSISGQCVTKICRMVSDIERRSYDFPWSHGVFRDCLLAGYQCIALERRWPAYPVTAFFPIAAGEAHILNLCVEPALQGRTAMASGCWMRCLLQRANRHPCGKSFSRSGLRTQNALALYK